jgi:hypothetical protein
VSTREAIKLRTDPIKAHFSLGEPRRKLPIALLATLMIPIMTVWFGVLGWGMIELLEWLGDFIKTLWSAR